MKIIINAIDHLEIIIDIDVKHHSFSDFIITDKSLILKLKFCLLLCYFYDIKWRLSIVFYL